MRKCKVCRSREAAWSLQYVGDDAPSFTIPGWHYRGFAVTPVCDECKERIRAEYAAQTGTVKHDS